MMKCHGRDPGNHKKDHQPPIGVNTTLVKAACKSLDGTGSSNTKFGRENDFFDLGGPRNGADHRKNHPSVG